MDELLKRFSITAMTEIINQRKVDEHFITDTFFKKWVPTLATNHEIIISKGEGIILESVSENGEHLVTQNDDETIISVPLPRFPQSDILPASEMNLLKTLNTEKEQTKSLSAAIGKRLAKQKSNITNTIEYMAIGAIFGKVMDGKGNVLFNLNANREEITITEQMSLLDLVRNIEQKQIKVLGTTKPYIALVTGELYNKLLEKAQQDEMFKNKTAEIINKNNVLSLSVFGKTFMPYEASYKNTKGKPTSYMSGKKGVAVPLDDSIFEIVYTRANHTAAIGKAPTKFFAPAPEVLDKGKGWAIVSESRPLPICNRLDAIIDLKME
ncbi:phage capsid protein E [Campylobacter pinnipediorum subsp. caledonicus]|uniref:Phage capsid protein E n=1 Tax=Campylobacter pinnipediorum subsp. caledonicus TaxID=1874362 RepID=A0A1S6U804_9BACT|nr:major capsid protein [Campylobacter pinnipediorum]AQW85476.1 phage capsid protein E [Campylobacter pinnipediorum subsp. caledonicus]AQW87888.1 phage capsid protein E [Campylobacter pinnipediorum subsp. caledonicus]